MRLSCRDGLELGGHLWAAQDTPKGRVIVNCATGVLARFYHRYARFLAGHGFEVLTYDYRGIGLSRPARLQGCGYRWRDWGERDFEAAVRFMHARAGPGLLQVVGHSIGGFLPGLAPNVARVDRLLTVGAQYAWWWDYAPRRRLPMWLRWHCVMPVATALLGYFPGRRFGWLEDLPAGVAYEWSFRGPRFERSHPKAERAAVLSRMRSFTGPLLAVSVADDEYGTVPAIHRTLRYYTGALRTAVSLRPADYTLDRIGHFNLFHDRHTNGFWADTLRWLRHGHNPWPARTLFTLPAASA